MALLYDVKCEDCGKVSEVLIDPAIRCTSCPECQGPALRQIPTPRFDPRMGIDARGCPTMGDKWARTRAQRKKIESKRALEHGAVAISSAGADIVR